MNLLVISDIHANIDALHAVWEKESDADAIVCAGDVVDWGFHPHEVIAWLKEHNVICVAGNHDHEIIWRLESGRREEPGKETNYSDRCVNQLTEEDFAWLRALPDTQIFEFDGIKYCMRHAYDVHEQVDELRLQIEKHRSIPFFDEYWKKFVGEPVEPERRIILGHTHICFIYQARAHELYLNPGSVHYRLGADAWQWGADYMVINDGIPQLRHVDFPTVHLRRMIKESNFAEDIKRPAYVYAGSNIDGNVEI